MDSTKPTVVPVADCNVIPSENGTLSETKDLCMMWPKFVESASATIDRTARYVENPTEYLKKTLGDEVFEERKAKFCLANTIDKDAYGTGEHKQHFEKHMANLLGKERGLFFITGIQAQLAAIKFHCDRAGRNRAAWLVLFTHSFHDLLDRSPINLLHLGI